jgi:competence protein ComEA
MEEQDPLYISKRNRRGVVALFVVSLIIVFLPRILMSLVPKESIIVSDEDIQLIDKRQEFFKYKRKFKNWDFKKKKFSIPPAQFNPNEYSKQQWIALGLSEKQTNVVLKFTSRGIHSNEDLKKIFVIPEALYDLIKDSTIYPAKDYKKELEKEIEIDRPTVNLVNLNKANVDEFTAMKGIGPFYAKQIIRYRDQLGGFYSKEQLLEVWKMNIETYDKIKDYVFIMKGELKQISLNNSNVNELNAHPYLNWNQSNSIIKLREQRGGFKSISDIKESVLIDEDTFEKLLPYLSL